MHVYLNWKAQIMFLPVQLERKRSLSIEHKRLVDQRAHKKHTSHKKMGRPKLLVGNICYSVQNYITMFDKPSECVYCSTPSTRKY